MQGFGGLDCHGYRGGGDGGQCVDSHRGDCTPPGHLQPFLGLNFYLVLVGGDRLNGVCPGAFGYSLDEECVICLRDGDEPRAGTLVGFSQSSKLLVPVWSDSNAVAIAWSHFPNSSDCQPCLRLAWICKAKNSYPIAVIWSLIGW